LFDETYSNKSIITGSSIHFRDLEECDLRNLFDIMGWTRFLEIDEIYYPNLIRIFYTNLFVSGRVLISRLCGKNVCISCEELAHVLEISFGGLDLTKTTLENFSYSEGQSIESASALIHGDNNTCLKTNENVVHFTLLCQILAKIIIHNIMAIAGEFGKAIGCITSHMYCVLTSQPTIFLL